MHDLSEAHDGQVTSAEFSRDGLLVATASRDNQVRIIDMRTYKVLQTMASSVKTPFRNLINWNRVVWSPDDKHLLAGGHNGDLFFWAADSGRLEAILPGVNMSEGVYGSASSSAASPVGSAGTSAGGGGLSSMGSLASGLAGIAPSFSSSSSSSLSSPASSSAAAVAAANAVSEQAISCVDWNRNGRQVISADHGGNVHVWEDDIATKTAAV
jgi:WD40 repeat protein